VSAITSPAARRGTKPTSTKARASGGDPLAPFSAPVRAWFESAFETPTPAQVGGWASISTGRHTLIHAPTGSGKTLAAFLWCLDRLARDPSPPPTRAAPGSVRVLYVSPLKALTYDVERNLRSPLHGIALAAQRLGVPEPRISIAGRTGDTPQEQRRELARRPPDILVTTPESLYLLLTSAARETLRGVETVILDEVHAIAGTKRGAHLALSLERLERLRPADAPRMQRIGLSATQRPLDEVARFLGGGDTVVTVNTEEKKQLSLRVEVPVEEMAKIGETAGLPSGPAQGENRNSIWPAIHPRLLELIRAHRSTLIFVNSRRLAERLAGALNELAGEVLVRSHHGSIARPQRIEIEDNLKSGKLPALIATSSLELGIDMGAIDLVIQIEAPPSIASGMQRIGRASHQVGTTSEGIIFPKYRGDLVACAAVTDAMHRDSANIHIGLGLMSVARNLERIALEVWSLAPKQLRYVPNGVDCARFAVASRGEGEKITVGTVASLRREKNIARLIEAFSQVASQRAAGSLEGKNTMSWGGAAGTWFWIDPTNDVFFVGMIQRLGGTGGDDLGTMARTLTYQALLHPEK